MCNNEFYEQIDGIAMSSPLGTLLANWLIGFEKILNRNLLKMIIIN